MMLEEECAVNFMYLLDIQRGADFSKNNRGIMRI